MARPRRQQRPPATHAPDAPDAPGAPHSPAPRDAEHEAQERLADVLVALVGEHLRDRIDPMSPVMEKYWAWKAKQARDALTPAERVDLHRRSLEFARRMKAEFEAQDRARARGDSGSRDDAPKEDEE